MKRILTGALAALSSVAAMAATTMPVQLMSPAGSSAGQAIVSTGSSTAPAWGNVTATALAAQAANTVVANITASSASPTAVAIPTCNTSTSALQYTPVTGWACYASSATTTGTLAQFAATTSAQFAGVISDETGTGVVVFNTGPAISTPTITGGVINNATVGATTAAAGKFTTLQATSTITPSTTAGIVGTTLGDNVQSGSAGENPTNTTNTVSLTSGIAANATSMSLSAGDWDVTCTGFFTPAGTTVQSSIELGISTTSATQPGGFNQIALLTASLPAGATQVISTPVVRQNLSATTTVFCVATVAFTTSTETVSGSIRARRVR